MKRKWEAARTEAEKGGYTGRLGHLKLEDVLFINSKLREYDALTDKFGAFIHM